MTFANWQQHCTVAEDNHCGASYNIVFVVAVKFIVSMLSYIAEVVVKDDSENGMMEDDGNSLNDPEDSDLHELTNDSVCIFLSHYLLCSVSWHGIVLCRLYICRLVRACALS